MTVPATGSQVVLLACDDSVEEELVAPPVVLVLEDRQVSAPGVVEVGDVVVGAAEQHLNLELSKYFQETDSHLLFVLGEQVSNRQF